jgi:hypothetical protein
MGQKKQTVWVLKYLINRSAMPLYYAGPWNKEGKFPKFCLAKHDATWFKTFEEAETEALALKQGSPEITWTIVTYNYFA